MSIQAWKLLIFISYLSKQATKRACFGWHSDCSMEIKQKNLLNFQMGETK
jgi:hypothetical protein